MQGRAGALFGGLRWGLWSAVGFAVLAMMLVVVSMRPGSREMGSSSADATEP